MSGYYFLKKIAYFCLKIFFTFTNSVDPDEMQHYAAFHLGLHCFKRTHLVVSLIQRIKNACISDSHDFNVSVPFIVNLIVMLMKKQC